MRSNAKRYGALAAGLLTISAIVVYALWDANLPFKAGAQLKHEPHSEALLQASSKKEGMNQSAAGQIVIARAKNESDSLFNSVAVLDLCDDPSLKKDVSTTALIEHYKSQHGPSSNVALTTERSVKSLCSSERHTLSGNSNLERDPYSYFIKESKSFQEAVAFAELLGSGEATGKDERQIQTFVLEKIRSSDSMYEFLETMSVFSETPALSMSLKDFRYPTALDKNIADYAAIIAACNIFGGCDARSPFSVRLCFLTCETPMSASEFAMHSVAEIDRGKLDSAVSAILAARRN